MFNVFFHLNILWNDLTMSWNELTISWNEMTFLWNEITFLWNEVTWNDLTMERNDRIPHIIMAHQTAQAMNVSLKCTTAICIGYQG